MNVLSLFDGISVGRLALERAGIKVDKYFASEIDPYAIMVTQSNFPDTIQLGDVKNVRVCDLPEIDLVIGGSPCQGFSPAGFKLGLDDPRSKLFYAYADLVNEVRPKYYFLENVKMSSQVIRVISAELDVEPVEINSNLVCAQNRKRLYWANWAFAMPDDKNITIHDALNLSPLTTIIGKGRGNRKNGPVKDQRKSPCITTSSWECNNFIQTGRGRRKFTAEEAEILQTLPKGYTKVGSLPEYKRIELIGNSWTVDVISHIFRYLDVNNRESWQV